MRGPIQVAEIAENRATCGGCGSLAARAADTKSLKKPWDGCKLRGKSWEMVEVVLMSKLRGR
jgi:hypothetical protein